MSTESKMAGKVLLEAKELTRKDGKTTRVDKVSLSLAASELVILKGQSGSGKTSLLRMLAGQLRPTSGDVRLDGESLVHLRDHHRVELLREQVGYLDQHAAVLDSMTALENLMLPLVPTGGPTEKERERGAALVETLGIRKLMDRTARTLSGGERQRLVAARALIRSPKVILFDEPTAHVDGQSAEAIFSLLDQERQNGAAVLITTHDPRAMEDKRVSRQLEMRDGVLVDSVLVG